MRIWPVSVPTRNLVGCFFFSGVAIWDSHNGTSPDASLRILTIVVSKSRAVPPTIVPFLSASSHMVSEGSLSLRISHHMTCPSVDAEKNSDPVLDETHARL